MPLSADRAAGVVAEHPASISNAATVASFTRARRR
jgi:hypothetical protein